MKTFRLFGACILAVILCFSFSSCSDDDEEDVSNSQFIGKWEVASGYWYSEPVFEFKSNGRFVFTGYDFWSNEGVRIFTTSPGDYSYNAQTKEFLLMWDHGGTDLWYVKNISENKIVFFDLEYATTRTFTRKN